MASPGPRPDTHPQDPPAAAAAATSAATAAASPPAMAGAAATASPQKSSQQQGQPFEPLDKSVSQTVKLNPKMELSRTDLLKLLSYMEAELQSRDVVIATLKTERVKNLLQYGRVGLSDPFLALQRDSIGGSVVRGGGVNEAELRAIEETQLAQLEHLIAQQRKAHQRMRHVLREAEKRHSRVVAELEEERRKHEHDTAQGDDVTYALEKDRTRLKQELESERAAKKKAEKELRKVQETLEEERGKQKQIILMLVEERKRLALQYVEERKRSEDLAQILSEEKGRIDSMAEGLEEESKKSLQMEAELEKQLADFDTERQQMRGQLTKKEERISELEAMLEKLQHEVDHYKKQLQEAHNVAMFQQTLSVSPPRIGIATRPSPPQLPAKPATLTQTQPRMPGLTPPKVAPRVRAASPGIDEVTGVPLSLGMSVAQHHVTVPHSSSGGANPTHMVPPGVAAMSSVTKAVQLTATVNSVPVAGPTTGIARGVQPGVGVRPVMYSVSTSEVTRTVTTAAKSYSVSESEGGWTGSGEGEGTTNAQSGVAGTVERGLVRVTGPGEVRGQAQVVQVTPRVNVSASPGTKVITTTHGGKVTFHVTTNAPTSTATSASSASNGQQQQQVPPQTMTMTKKPPPPARSTQPGGPPPPVPSNKPLAAPPIPPNKPAVPPKKDLVTRVGAGGQGVSVEPGTPISVEVKPQKVGPQTVKFGITISKTPASGSQTVGSGGGSSQTVVGVGPGGSGGGSDAPVAPAVEGGAVSPRRDAAQVGGGGPPVHATACVDSLSPELEHFHQLLISMAGSSNIAVPTSPNLAPSLSSVPDIHNVSSSPSPVSPSSSSISSPVRPLSPLLPPLSPPPPQTAKLSADDGGLVSPPLCTVASSPQAFSFLTSPSSQAAVTASSPSSSNSSVSPPPLPSSSPPPLFSSSPLSPTLGSMCISTNSSPVVSLASSLSSTLTPSASVKNNYCSSIPGVPPPLPLTDPPVLLAPMDGEELEPPHSPLDVSTPLTMDGMTALHLAAHGNNWQSVPVLVRCGASVSAEDDDGRTPTYLALLYACTPAAAELLSFPQSLEHTTKDGCNYLHAAIKSGEVECVELLVQHILAAEAGPNLLHRLATGPDHRGNTPLALALSTTNTQMLSALSQAGLDLAPLINHNPRLVNLASSAALALISSSDRSECTCSVWIEGLELEKIGSRDTVVRANGEEGLERNACESGQRWAVGAVRVTPATLWAALEETLTSLVLHHWEALARSQGVGIVSSSSTKGRTTPVRGERRRSDPLQEIEVCTSFLGLNKSAVSHFSIGHHKWTRGEYGLVSGPYDLLVNNSAQDICIHLHTLEATAYSLLVPVPILKNYLRLIEQSQCVVVYGPKDSGKRSLVRCLAQLKGGGSVGITHIDMGGGISNGESVRGILESGGGLVVIERVSREAWPGVWGTVCGSNNGTVLVTMDAWRRPGGGQLEGGVLWVQLRHDREPMVAMISRAMTRHMASLHAGVLPSPNSQTQKAIDWVAGAWGRLAATLMALGFSSALHGPHLFIQTLLGANNPRDILRGVEHLWNNVISAEIRTEVISVWRKSSVGGEVDEARVTSMALYVVIQRSLAPGLPLPTTEAHSFLAALDGGLGRSAFRGIKPPLPPPRPKDLPLDVVAGGSCSPSFERTDNSHQMAHPVGLASPTSPDWDEANLTKILGLSPMGYA